VAHTARYTRALPVYVTPAVREQLDQLAEKHCVSLAEIVRDIIDHGLPRARRRWAGLDDQ
jgi:predicted DNA-binding protein